MSSPQDRPAPHVEVPDAAAAFHKTEAFIRRLLAVPKKEIDKKLAKERAAKKKRKLN
jgi:hypothetical protein